MRHTGMSKDVISEFRLMGLTVPLGTRHSPLRYVRKGVLMRKVADYERHAVENGVQNSKPAPQTTIGRYGISTGHAQRVPPEAIAETRYRRNRRPLSAEC
jgi:hypothetical protein